MNVLDFQKKKQQGEKISMITCYDYTYAQLMAETDVDALLVGDSLAMVIYGHETTVSATVPMMSRHTAAVKRGAGGKFIISDLPFLSFRKGLTAAVEAAGELMQAGASAVKLEGAEGNEEIISHLVHSGIPVMGHLGLTPQFYHVFGGNRVQGRGDEAGERLLQQAEILQDAGCFSLVLECVPAELTEKISRKLSIPVIGIGAGKEADGQVLVNYDLLGMENKKSFKFVRRYHNGAEAVLGAVQSYVKDIQTGVFPSEKESFQ